jgi:hypothetical protein
MSFSQERESEVLAIPDGCIHQAIDDHRGWLIEKGSAFWTVKDAPFQLCISPFIS